MSAELLLVGSIPLDTPEDVFRMFGSSLGRYLFAMPDGEVGPRRHWISRVHYQVLAAHPELDVVQHPAPDDNGVERQHPRNAADALPSCPVSSTTICAPRKSPRGENGGGQAARG